MVSLWHKEFVRSFEGNKTFNGSNVFGTVFFRWPKKKMPNEKNSQEFPNETSCLAGKKKAVVAVGFIYRWVFPKIRVPQNGWFMMENSIKIDDLGENPLFLETPIHGGD